MQQARTLSRRQRQRLIRLCVTLVTGCGVLIWLYPVWLTLFSSVKSDAELLQGPLTLPRHPTLDAYANVWNAISMGMLLKNSLIITLGGVVLSIALGMLPAYALSRFRIPGGEAIFLVVLAGLTIPYQLVAFPLYDLLRHLGLLDSLVGLIIVDGVYGIPFCMLVLRGFMANIPREVELAGRVDGCSDAGILRHIIFPLSLPAIGTLAVLQFISLWNEFFFALILLSSNTNFPITVGVLAINQSRYFASWNLPSAALVISQLPTIIVYLCAQRWVVQGGLGGALKG